MKSLSADEVCRAVRARWLRRPARPDITGVSTDSRTAVEGDVFFAIRGPRFDGHDYLAAAEKAGCSAAVVSRRDGPETSEGFGRMLVPDTTRALGDLAGFYRAQLPGAVVGVTGSNGKTTVKRMIHHILSGRLVGTCSPKSFNNQIGLPLTLLAARPGDDYVVCEIGTNAPGEVAALGAIARPNAVVVTSVAPAHLEKLGSIERVAVEKVSLLGCVADNGLAVINGDSDLLARAARGYECRVVRFGEREEAELRLTGYEPSGPAQQFQLNGRLWVELPLAGRHNALNALAAIAVAQRLGIGQEEAAAALADFPGTEMRLEWLRAGPVTVLNDAYNANPASVAAAAQVLVEAPGTRKVAVLGDMLELGEEARALHEQTGREVAAMGVDLLIGVGELGRYTAQGAAEAGAPTEAIDSVELACARLPKLLREGDVVLIKGSRAVGMEALTVPIRAAFEPPRPSDEGRGADS